MGFSFTSEEKEKIAMAVHRRYSQTAKNPAGHFKYPTGKAGLEGLKYDKDMLKRIPQEVQETFCGVGNPFNLGVIGNGQSVLDIGCGTGVDALIAGLMVGPGGSVFGIDMVPEMIEKAKENLALTGLKNVQFQLGTGEVLRFRDESFDAIISSGAFNLIPDKLTTLKESFRVLKPGGRFMIADQVLTTLPPNDIDAKIQSWAR